MMFGCEETRRYIDAWIDGELDPGASLLVETHVVACGGCHDEAEVIRSLKRTMSALREGDRAPMPLRARVLAALDAEDRGHAEAAASARKRRHASGFVMAGAALAGLVVLTGRTPATTPPDVRVAGAGMFPPILEDIAARHARDLPVEVSSNQPEQVAKFFEGRLDYPVRPVAFRGVTAHLLGARISNVRDRMAAAVFYEVGGRRMTVFVFDGGLIPQAPEGVQQLVVNNQIVYVGSAHGYTVAVSERGGVGYAVATDLPAQDAVRMVAQAELP